VCSSDLIQRCSDVADWLGPRAARLGLTQYATGAEVARELMAPGFPLVAELSGVVGGVAEAGAGCGALGLSLGVLCPTIEIALIDRRRRAAGFIDLVIRRFAIANARAVCDDLRGHAGRYDLVVARAVAPGAEFLGELSLLHRENGRVALIEAGEARCAPAGLERSAAMPTAIEGLRVDIYEAVTHER